MQTEMKGLEQGIEQNLPAIIHTASAVYWGGNLILAIEEGNPTRLLQVGLGLLGHYLANKIKQSQVQCGAVTPQ
ncbi:hypothetical protein [Alicyclobacillus sp. ALC3]|uniref:hypothetical protein n=1 Tax=Alicyclobacillus sp. ALC3 TaxID=2796143 RepID=UPI002377E803|nr:hypothetical protein [Alicyclobacillus sp. ALC3]WDL98835.1 hypothetical protein JC200_09375 [Alicyclobacillus sp. ALC3]